MPPFWHTRDEFRTVLELGSVTLKINNQQRVSCLRAVPGPENAFSNGKRIFIRKTQFLRYYSVRGQLRTRVNTERLAERETLLNRLGSKLNRTVLNSCGNSLSVPQKHVTFPAARFFCEQSHFHEIDYFWKHQTSNSRLKTTTVFDNSIPLRKNDLLRITYFRIPGVPDRG